MINPIRTAARLRDVVEVYFALSALLAAASLVNSFVLLARL
jgi:hypothetical protein